MEIALILALVAVVILLSVRQRTVKTATKKALLDEAWRIVLNDPNYHHRRNYEERMRKDEAQIRKSEGL